MGMYVSKNENKEERSSRLQAEGTHVVPPSWTSIGSTTSTRMVTKQCDLPSRQPTLLRSRASNCLSDETKVASPSPEPAETESTSTVTFSSMVMESGRRMLRTNSSVHPSNDLTPSGKYHVENTSLPPPTYEREQKTSLRLRHSYSLPMQCPPRRSEPGPMAMPISNDFDGDAEYLSRLYDNRTWNMYQLITESRRKQRAVYHSAPEEKAPEWEDDEFDDLASDMLDSLSHSLIFPFDIE